MHSRHVLRCVELLHACCIVSIAVFTMCCVVLCSCDGAQLISLDRGYFYYWMNTWDSLVFAVAITLLIDTGLSNFAFVVSVCAAVWRVMAIGVDGSRVVVLCGHWQIVLVFRSVRHLEAVLNVMKAIHLMIRVHACPNCLCMIPVM